MRSDLAKVLHRLDGRPLINHVCRTATALAPAKIYVVIGHQGDDVKTAVLNELEEQKVVFVTAGRTARNGRRSQLSTASICKTAIRRLLCFPATCR